MNSRPTLGLAATGLAVLLLAVALPNSWGRRTNRIGTVLAVEGEVKVQPRLSKEWKKLRFREAVFLKDLLHSGKKSKAKVLLRDDSIWTLLGSGDIAFDNDSEPTCRLVKAQKHGDRSKASSKRRSLKGRSIATLRRGKLRVTSTKLTGDKAVAEVRTPNSATCMQGTDFIVSYENGVSEVTVIEGQVTVQNLDHATPHLQIVTANTRSVISAASAPTAPVAVLQTALNELTQEIEVTAQVPSEVPAAGEAEELSGTEVITKPGASDGTESQGASNRDADINRSEDGDGGAQGDASPPGIERLDGGIGGSLGGADLQPDGSGSPAVEITTALGDAAPPLDVITPDTAPTAEAIIRRSIVEFTVQFPR